VIRADSRLFEGAGAVGRQESNEARTNLEWLRGGREHPANARFGRRDIASLFIMIEIIGGFRGAVLMFDERRDFEAVG
jgi:hypothetical protein